MRNQRCVGCLSVCPPYVSRLTPARRRLGWLNSFAGFSFARNPNAVIEMIWRAAQRSSAQPSGRSRALSSRRKENKQTNKQDMQQFHPISFQGFEKKSRRIENHFSISAVAARLQPCELLRQIPFYFSSRASTLNSARRCERWRP